MSNRDADSPLANDGSYDLVAGNDILSVTREITLDNVQIGPAHAASSYLNKDFTRFGIRRCPLREPKRGCLEGPGARDFPRFHIVWLLTKTERLDWII